MSLLPQLLSQMFVKREPRYHIALRFLGYLLLSIGCVMAGYLLYTHFAFTVGDQRKAGLACLAVIGIGLALLLYKRKPSANPMSDLLKDFDKFSRRIISCGSFNWYHNIKATRLLQNKLIMFSTKSTKNHRLIRQLFLNTMAYFIYMNMHIAW